MQWTIAIITGLATLFGVAVFLVARRARRNREEGNRSIYPHW